MTLEYLGATMKVFDRKSAEQHFFERCEASYQEREALLSFVIDQFTLLANHRARPCRPFKYDTTPHDRLSPLFWGNLVRDFAPHRTSAPGLIVRRTPQHVEHIRCYRSIKFDTDFEAIDSGSENDGNVRGVRHSQRRMWH